VAAEDPLDRICRAAGCGLAACALTLLAFGAGAAPPAAAGDVGSAPEPTLESLMRSMAATSGVVARFLERKQLALLSAPLEVRGTLYFVPPRRLARFTTEPGRTQLVIDGDRFAYRDEAGGDEVDLSENRVAREFVTNFIVLFGGDLDALRERYEPEFRVEGERWSLTLRPLRRPLADIVERVTLEGSGRALARMEMRETDGDRTTTDLTDVQVDRRFSSEELEQLFPSSGAAAEAP
jgi:hypothetical protein